MQITRTEETHFENSVKRITFLSSIVSVIVALITAGSVGYGFYFKTTSNLEQNKNDIQEINIQMRTLNEKMNEVAVYKGVSETQINELQLKVEKMDEKLDKIILLTSK
jgi:hypothetical protein